MALLKNKYFIVTIILFTFLLDRLLKIMLLEREGFFIIKNFLKINYYPNWGIAFSMPVSRFIVYPLIIIILIIVFYYLTAGLKSKDYFLIWACALIFVGAFSNLLDRFRFGHVVDYINFTGRFPVFNLSDVMIVTGVGLLIIKGLKKK